MPLINTNDLLPDAPLDALTRLQIYNGLDTTITFEVFEELRTLSNNESDIYNYERALQGPILEIMMRGFLIDETERQRALTLLRGESAHLNSILQRYAYAVWDRELNPRSTKQLQSFFYTHMKLPEQWISEKGVKKLSFKREVLEKLEAYFIAMPIIACILAIREREKQIEQLETEVDSDGRMRTSYNIAGTETWRLSSSSNAYGTGGNLQNFPQHLRRMFIADPGYKICSIDLEQAEARELGFIIGVLFDDWTYLDNCESGDLHTSNCRLIWPQLPWTGDIKLDRKIADQSFYRDFSYRDMSKRGGHAINYVGTDFTIARHLKVPIKLISDFRSAYFPAFPAIPRFHQWVAREIQTTQRLTTHFDCTRHFFGRATDESTVREAVAFMGQSPTAIRTNLALLRHWQHFRSSTQLLAQTHDSITFQYLEALEDQIVPTALKLVSIPLTHKSRIFTIPGEAKVGWNWANHHDPSKPIGPKNRLNSNGLIKYKGHDDRKRLVGVDREV